MVTTTTNRGLRCGLRRAPWLGLVIVLSILALTPGVHAGGSGPILNPDNGHYYEWYNAGSGLTFDAAEALAESRTLKGVPGHRVTVTSAAEESFLASNYPIGTVRYWVGGSDEGSEGQWYWVTGEPWGYENWGPGEPNGGTNESCIEYQPVNTVQWNDIPCQGSIPDLLIEYDGTPVPAMPMGALVGLLMVLLVGTFAVMRYQSTLHKS